MAGAKSLVCRQIEEQDLGEVAALLTQGFKDQRSGAFWQQALARLADHDGPATMPRFGYALQANDAIVGVILLISTLLRTEEAPFVRCNLSSWYVCEPFRIYAPLLVSRALRHREATYFNLTAVPHTFPILHAQGFHPYCSGRFMAVAALARGPAGTEIVTGDSAGVSEAESTILTTHAAYGCISVVCRHGGQAHPFVFAPRRKFGVAGMALLAYCRQVADFVRFAGPLGRFLLKRGLLLVSIDADGPIDGLVGHFSAKQAEILPRRAPSAARRHGVSRNGRCSALNGFSQRRRRTREPRFRRRGRRAGLGRYAVRGRDLRIGGPDHAAHHVPVDHPGLAHHALDQRCGDPAPLTTTAPRQLRLVGACRRRPSPHGRARARSCSVTATPPRRAIEQV